MALRYWTVGRKLVMKFLSVLGVDHLQHVAYTRVVALGVGWSQRSATQRKTAAGARRRTSQAQHLGVWAASRLEPPT